ncbi:MAG: hypothetical protein B7Y48_06360 [Methylophilales bacterium 28-44-11]|nr:MAG: hypothetical protein B7Y48_06360 [Methylophilales bacterium 28-44-11]
MDNNFKLRKAIIIAIALMGTGYSLHSKAIGLGDIQVKSYLGQPLLANIKVTGLDSKMDERCFNIKSDDVNAISNVNFRLSRISDESGLLTLTSNKAVLEPIASVTVVSQCDTTFTRQYSLLIDPAGMNGVTTNTIEVSDSANNANVNNADSEVGQGVALAAVQTNNTNASTNRKARRQAKPKADSAQVTPSSSNAQITYLMPEKPETVKPVAVKPKLTISGGNLPAIDLSAMPMKLSFDKRINTSRETNPQAYSAQAEFADEVTVMNNRLAHLDKQLNSLYTQNATLKQANARSMSEVSALKQQNDVLRMIAFCLGGGLLATGYFFVDWLRRRSFLVQAEKEQALWESLQSDEFDAEENVTFKIDSSSEKTTFTAPKSSKADEELSEMSNAPLFNSTYPSQQQHEIIHEETNITDDAELLISHGRIHLAIELLQNHLIETPKDSASTWLFLLDLLAKEGMQNEFEIAANECKKHFNVQVDGFSRPLADSNSLESFERISKELQKLWGTEEALRFLDELIYNTRLEPRAGFDQPVFEELVLLREIAEEEVKLAEVISLHKEKTTRRQKKEKTMTINLPEIEISEEFKQLALVLKHQLKT